jgi:hypothetical protein
LFFCVSLLTYSKYAALRYSKNNAFSLILAQLSTRPKRLGYYVLVSTYLWISGLGGLELFLYVD